MEFWSAEVVAGGCHIVYPAEDYRSFHLTHAVLAKSKCKEDDKPVRIYIKINDVSRCLGSIYPTRSIELRLELYCHLEAELWHSSKDSSVYFYGVHVPLPGRVFSFREEADSDLDYDEYWNDVNDILPEEEAAEEEKDLFPEEEAAEEEKDLFPIEEGAEAEEDRFSIIEEFSPDKERMDFPKEGDLGDYYSKLTLEEAFFPPDVEIEDNLPRYHGGLWSHFRYWNANVNPGRRIICKPKEKSIIYIAQAAFIPEEDDDPIYIYVRVDGRAKKLLGTLSASNFNSIRFCFYINKRFELSHSSQKASVYFLGFEMAEPGRYPLSFVHDFVLEPWNSIRHWSVTVEPGTCRVKRKEHVVVVLTHASLENSDDSNEDVLIYVKTGMFEKSVIGALTTRNCAQINFYLVFRDNFELSHTSKNARVHFFGYEFGLPVYYAFKEEQGEIGAGKADVVKEENSAAKKDDCDKESDDDKINMDSAMMIDKASPAIRFWSARVMPAEHFRVKPEKDRSIFITQAAFVPEEGDEPIYIYVKTDGHRKSFLGTLSRTCTQMVLEVCFDKGFELSHTSKKTSVYILGYGTAQHLSPPTSSEVESDEELTPGSQFSGEIEPDDEFDPWPPLMATKRRFPWRAYMTNRIIKNVDVDGAKMMDKSTAMSYFRCGGNFSSFRYWMAKVKPRDPLRVEVEKNRCIFIAQVGLMPEEVDDPMPISIYVKVDGHNHSFLGTCSSEHPHSIMLKCFSKGFVLVHTSSKANVYFWGYELPDPLINPRTWSETESDEEQGPGAQVANEIESDEEGPGAQAAKGGDNSDKWKDQIPDRFRPQLWIAKVKPGYPFRFKREKNRRIYIKEVVLMPGEGADPFPSKIYFLADGYKKTFLGSLSSECPYMAIQKCFDKGFEIFHNSDIATVYLSYYELATNNPATDSEIESDEEEVAGAQNGIISYRFSPPTNTWDCFVLWSAEVKPGLATEYTPESDMVVHLTHASIGKSKDDEELHIYLQIDGEKSILGIISPGKCTHISFNLYLDKSFLLSHSSQSTGVYFFGRETFQPKYPSRS